jgi:tRNA 5-methylaminomethyl-2-thiouridine biosynthesis bifunctional protein
MTPLQPAQIVFDADGVPTAPAFGDRYHPRVGAAVQAQAVFLAGNRLPERWAGQPRFTVLETGFGLGRNFLATWAAWRADPQRPRQLHYVGIEAHPPAAADRARAASGSAAPELDALLHRAWPLAMAGWHPIDLDDGQVQLLLVFGDIGPALKDLDLMADAFYLDGFAPDRNPAMWDPAVFQALARRAAPGATAASWTVARRVREGLQAAGFVVDKAPGFGDKRETLRANFAPRPGMHRASPRGAPEGQALVLGAGLAGAWAAQGLRQQGWQVEVWDRHAAPAQEASGNPGGLFHGTVSADDGTHARLLRAAALLAERTLRPWISGGQIPGRIAGLLRLVNAGATVEALQALLDRHGFTPDHVQLRDAASASADAGLPLPGAAWFFPGGGWVAPPALVRHLLADLPFRGRTPVARIERRGSRWWLFDAGDAVLGETTTLVLANAADAARLWPDAGWPLGRARGQIGLWAADTPGGPQPRLPVAGNGYLLTLDDGRLLAGATAAPGDEDPALRPADDDFNRARLLALCGWAAPPAPDGRVGWRVHTPDRLPIIGAVPAAGAVAHTQARRITREPGLFVLAALGSRGLTWGPLAGRMLAAWVTGSPMPVAARLRDAVDPARWVVRRARRAG